MRVLDRLVDTPAMVLTGSGETLVQTPAAVALLGDETAYDGLSRNVVHRWFTDPASRDRYPVEDQPQHARVFTADLRTAYTREGPDSFAGRVVADLEATSADFRALWAEHEVGLEHPRSKRIRHPEVGLVEVQCQTLFDAEQSQGLLVFTATPGTESHEKLRLLSVIGTQELGAQR
ncbi:MAG TPA: XRE family transcriptional regulator [Nocardioides sp.]